VLAVVSCDGEHHDAATATWNFCRRNDRYCGLRLHLYAETKKEPLNTAMLETPIIVGLALLAIVGILWWVYR
jgi:hypothetical protein